MLSQLRGAQPPFLDPTDGVAPTLAEARRGEGLLLAGSGSNLPLVRRLVAGYARAHPGPVPEVAPSIGSTGAARAVVDGAVDVGLLSRPLRPDEARLGLRVFPLARVPVVLAAHPGVRAEGLTRAELLAAYAGESMRWPDGSPLLVLQREQGDSSHAAAAAVLPGFAEANERAYRERRWPVVYTDEAMLAALESTPGGLGLTDLGQLAVQGSPLRRLRLDGVAPTPEALGQGRYPLGKELAFVIGPRPRPGVEELLGYLRGPEARALAASAGYLVSPGEAP